MLTILFFLAAVVGWGLFFFAMMVARGAIKEAEGLLADLKREREWRR